MAGGYSRSPEPRSLTSAVERFIVSNESMTKCTRSSCSTHSCKLGGKSMGVFRSMLTNRVATYSQRTSHSFYSNQSPTGSGEPRSETAALASVSEIFQDAPMFASKIFRGIYFVALSFAGIANLLAADDYTLGQDSMVHEGVPQGEVTKHKWESKIFPGKVPDNWNY